VGAGAAGDLGAVEDLQVIPNPVVSHPAFVTYTHVTIVFTMKHSHNNTSITDILICTEILFILHKNNHLSCPARRVLHWQAKSVRPLFLEKRPVLVIVLERHLIFRHNLIIEDTGRREFGEAPTIGHAITL
jgi:hypothetical protein